MTSEQQWRPIRAEKQISCQVAVFFSPDWLVRTECISFPQLLSGLRAPMKEEVQTVAVRGQYLETTWKSRQGRVLLLGSRLEVIHPSCASLLVPHQL